MPTLKKIADLIDAELVGDPKVEIQSIGIIASAKKNQLAYVVSNKYKDDLINSKAGAVIINKNLLDYCSTNALVVDDAYLAFAKITHIFKKPQSDNIGIHPSAKINNAKLASNCVIGKNVVIGANCSIGANAVIEDGVSIGSNTLIQSNVSILQDCSIGNNVVIESGSVIGSEGFGNAKDKEKAWHAIAHLGNVTIGDNVLIGSNASIDRGVIEDTQIHNGARIDNLVHIAHNVIIGEHTAIAACVGIAGSTVLGKYCMIGGVVGISGHISICDNVTVNSKSAVNQSIKHPGVYTGIIPIMPHQVWKKVGFWLTKLDKIAKYLKITLKDIK